MHECAVLKCKRGGGGSGLIWLVHVSAYDGECRARWLLTRHGAVYHNHTMLQCVYCMVGSILHMVTVSPRCVGVHRLSHHNASHMHHTIRCSILCHMLCCIMHDTAPCTIPPRCHACTIPCHACTIPCHACTIPCPAMHALSYPMH